MSAPGAVFAAVLILGVIALGVGAPCINLLKGRRARRAGFPITRRQKSRRKSS